MRTFALLLLLVIAPLRDALAHPGVGIVRDRQGNVFYTDLTHVWRIAPNGQKSIAVRDVHTHELSIDSLGNVFGEDNRYLGSGEGDDRYRHRIWRRSPDGTVTDIVPWTPNFWRDYGFARDRSGATYWAKCPARVCTLYRRPAEGASPVVVAPPGKFNNSIQSFAASVTEPKALYVVDGKDLRKLDSTGRVTTVAANVGSGLMGLHPTAQGDVYAAVWGKRAVVRIKPNGHVVTAARSTIPWAPSGVLVAPDGSLWILEYSITNAARVRQVLANGRSRVF